VRAGTVVAIALVAFGATWLATSGGGRKPEQPKAQASIVSAADLRTLSGALRQPIYWAGPQAGKSYELTRASGGRIYIRYLPPGVTAGSAEALPTVGTYPLKGALATTKRAAQSGDAVRISIGGSGIAFYSRHSPANVYLAFSGSSYQVEVFDPSPTRAHELVASGRIVPVGAVAPSEARAHAVTPAALAALQHSVGHGVYWAGAMPGGTYELTQTGGGRIYVRYLPRGVPVGTTRNFLTVGTYPLANAFSVTRRLAREASAMHVDAGRGAVAFSSRNAPTSVYVAFRGSPVQIEVYDPVPARARALVTSGKIVPVG
jgi:hypothetical protein